MWITNRKYGNLTLKRGGAEMTAFLDVRDHRMWTGPRGNSRAQRNIGRELSGFWESVWSGFQIVLMPHPERFAALKRIAGGGQVGGTGWWHIAGLLI
jgi:hypothetical protein